MKIWNLKSELHPCPSLLDGLFPVPDLVPKRIAAVGSGGKTTLLFSLAREFRARGQTVLLLPTTHMMAPEKDGIYTGSAQDVRKKLERDGFAVAGIPASPSGNSKHPQDPMRQKISFPGWEVYEKAGAAAQVVLMEADGSRRLPLKFPAPHEPLLPADVDLILSVTGMSALGKSPKEVCHRYSLAFSCLQKKDWPVVLPEDLFLLQREGYLKPLKRDFPHARVLPVWNQADQDTLAETAFQVLKDHGETQALITSLCL